MQEGPIAKLGRVEDMTDKTGWPVILDHVGEIRVALLIEIVMPGNVLNPGGHALKGLKASVVDPTGDERSNLIETVQGWRFPSEGNKSP